MNALINRHRCSWLLVANAIHSFQSVKSHLHPQNMTAPNGRCSFHRILGTQPLATWLAAQACNVLESSSMLPSASPLLEQYLESAAAELAAAAAAEDTDAVNIAAADMEIASAGVPYLLTMLLEMLPFFLRHASAAGELRLALGGHALAHEYQSDDHPEFVRVR